MSDLTTDTFDQPEPDPFHDAGGEPVEGDPTEMAAWGQACWEAGVDPAETAKALGLS